MDLAAKSARVAIAAVPEAEYGVYNDVNERAEHLITALRTISSQNSLGGYVYKGEKDLEEAGPDSEPSKIWQRGGAETPWRLDAAAARKDREEYVPRWEFGQAIGLVALQGVQRPIMTKSAIYNYANRSYREFVKQYGGVKKVAKRRNRYREKLEKGLAKRSSLSETRTA